MFAKTFLHEPQLWLLDEPLMPLDPNGQIEMIELLAELQAMGKSVVIVTNRLEDVSKLCDADSQGDNFVGILKSGQFAVFNRFSELQREVTGTDSPSPNWFNEIFLEVTKT